MRRSLRILGMASVLTFAATVPLAAAGPVEDCYDRVLERCDAALAEAKWYEKIAIGALCTGLLAGCTGSVFAQ